MLLATLVMDSSLQQAGSVFQSSGPKTVFLFDSHSRDENGGFVSNGCSVLLSFRYLNDVQYYIHAVYSKQLSNFPEIQYEIYTIYKSGN